MRAGGFDEDPGKPFAVETLGFVAGMTTMIGIDQLVHLYMIRTTVYNQKIIYIRVYLGRACEVSRWEEIEDTIGTNTDRHRITGKYRWRPETQSQFHSQEKTERQKDTSSLELQQMPRSRDQKRTRMGVGEILYTEAEQCHVDPEVHHPTPVS